MNASCHLSYPFGMLMPQRYKEWNSSNCITSTKPVWVTVIDTYYIDMPHVDWATLGGTRFDPSDDYGHPIFDETNTLTGIYIQYTEDGFYGDFSSLEAGGNYDFVFDVPNVLGTNLQMQVVELLEDRTERILATKDISGPEDNLSINFTPSTRDVRVKVIRTDAEGSEVPYISIKNLKWYYYHQQLETQLVNICSDVDDRYRFGYGGHHKDNELKGIGNSLDMGDRWLDSRIGRTPKPDAKAVFYPSVSPFSFALNTPIQAKDPDGKVVIFINGQHGGSGGKSDYWRVFSDIKIGIRSEKDGNGRWHTSEIHQTKETYAFDKALMDRIGDHKAIYKDGALGGWKNTFTTQENLSAEVREYYGHKRGVTDAKNIIANLKRDGEGNITETIKLVTHSLGGAYGKGYANAILDYAEKNKIKGVKIEFEADFAPFQPEAQKALKRNGMGQTYQFSHSGDGVAGDKSEEGAIKMNTSKDPNDGDALEQHKISSFENSSKQITK